MYEARHYENIYQVTSVAIYEENICVLILHYPEKKWAGALTLLQSFL